MGMTPANNKGKIKNQSPVTDQAMPKAIVKIMPDVREASADFLLLWYLRWISSSASSYWSITIMVLKSADKVNFPSCLIFLF
jgi:hypothetical protein